MPGIFAPLILFGGTLLGVWGYNHLLNNYEWKTPAFRTVSFATGLFGHTEYTKFTDGSQDVKIYPGLGHRYLDSRLLQDLDGDGTVDGTNPRVSVKNMAVFVLDEANDVWHKLPVSGVYPETKTAKAGVIHFSVYAVLGVPDQDVSKSYAYPVPFRPGRGDAKITFASLPSFGRIRVYTASGEKVKEILFVDPNGSKLEWDVTNSDGEDLARGVYLYIVESGDNRKTGKLMVIK